MRSYMARKCDIHFPLERKLSRFLTAAMRVYRVYRRKNRQRCLPLFNHWILKAIATEVMYKLFAMLEMKYDFKLSKDSKGKEDYMNKKIFERCAHTVRDAGCYAYDGICGGYCVLF